MHDQADKQDAVIDERIAKLKEENDSKSLYGKLDEFNEPRYLIYTGLFGCLLAGSTQPIWAIFYSKCISMLTMPL